VPVDGQNVAGVTVPDTKLAREATDLVRAATTDLVYHHSRRVYFWGSLQGRNRGLSYDPELLYIGAMFHDLGLNAEHRDSGRPPTRTFNSTGTGGRRPSVRRAGPRLPAFRTAGWGPASAHRRGGGSCR
jgi:HD domain